MVRGNVQNFSLWRDENRASGMITAFREYLPLHTEFQETNPKSFVYLPNPNNRQSMSKIDFLTVATIWSIFTDIHS